jgi:hypothetical protein
MPPDESEFVSSLREERGENDDDERSRGEEKTAEKVLPPLIFEEGVIL